MTTKTQLLPTRYTVNYQRIMYNKLTINQIAKLEN